MASSAAVAALRRYSRVAFLTAGAASRCSLLWSSLLSLQLRLVLRAGNGGRLGRKTVLSRRRFPAADDDGGGEDAAADAAACDAACDAAWGSSSRSSTPEDFPRRDDGDRCREASAALDLGEVLQFEDIVEIRRSLAEEWRHLDAESATRCCSCEEGSLASVGDGGGDDEEEDRGDDDG